MPDATVNGVRIYHELHGASGEPIVFVHGYTGDITDWRAQIAEFSPTHRVLVLDHRGHGRSEAPKDRDSYTIEAMAGDVEALAAHVGFDHYHLVGHSMGGAVAQEIALRSPGRLISLTIEDSGDSFTLSRNEAVANWLRKRMELADTEGMAAVSKMASSYPPPPHARPERQQETTERLARMSVDGFIGAWNALDRWPGTRDRLHDIHTPTLVIYGELDAGLVAAAKRLAEGIDGAELVVIPEAGHSPQEERPELFNQALRRHIERNAASGAK